MRYVLIPDDMGSETYSILPSVLLSGAQVVIWRPSLSEIQQQYDEGKLPYNARDFIRLIEEGYVVAAGRENWYAGANSRNQNQDWLATCPWKFGLDEELYRLSRDGSSLPLPSRKAIVADAPTGYDWAEEIVEKKPNLLERAANLVERGQLPSGILARANRAPDLRAKAVRAIATARNVARAEEEVMADIPIQPSPFAANVAILGDRRAQRFGPKDMPTPEKLIEAVRLVHEYSNFTDFKSFIKFLNSPKRQQVLDGIEPLMMSPSVIQEMQRNLHRKGLDLALLESMKPNSISIGMSSFSFLFTWIGAVFYAPLTIAGLSSYGGTLMAFLSVPTRLAEKLNLVTLTNEDAKNIGWVTQLHYGKPTPKLKQVLELRKILNNFAEKNIDPIISDINNKG